ncbi:MerC domain-containing protein [Sphingomonas sp. HF-S3]|uniref:MerC domain-containing protein n=1 Tax=Sphingomonas rustica TaxID=3103142 RepID=A0ABV0BA38_9SPHN
MVRQSWLDGVATALSLTCLIHCLALPLLLAALPVLGAVLHLPDSFHGFVLAAAVPVSLFALRSGHRRHGRSIVLGLAITGLSLMALGYAGPVTPRGETFLTVAGSIAVAIAHITNWRMTRRRGACPAPAATQSTSR